MAKAKEARRVRNGALALSAFLVLSAGCTGAPPPEPEDASVQKIQRSQLEEMFESIRGTPGWDLDSELVWDYYFTSQDEAVLLAAAADLEALGYEVVGILRPTPEEDDQETLFLQARRIEHHTVDSLMERNEELYAFAEEKGLASYDGMDMSRPEPSAGE